MSLEHWTVNDFSGFAAAAALRLRFSSNASSGGPVNSSWFASFPVNSYENPQKDHLPRRDRCAQKSLFSCPAPAILSVASRKSITGGCNDSWSGVGEQKAWFRGCWQCAGCRQRCSGWISTVGRTPRRARGTHLVEGSSTKQATLSIGSGPQKSIPSKL